MKESALETELASLLAKYSALGGVLDYVFLEEQSEAAPVQLHRAAALAGIAAIDRRLEQWALSHVSGQYPMESFFRVHWNPHKLTGEQVSFAAFWGTDDVEPKPMGERAWSIPNVDGYKTAFFHPPYCLQGSPREKADLFVGINRFVLGEEQERAEIFSWSTDWSNYFDAGHEWWGAFLWTIRAAGSRRVVVVAASSTD
jgi:hypothetical protein